MRMMQATAAVWSMCHASIASPSAEHSVAARAPMITNLLSHAMPRAQAAGGVPDSPAMQAVLATYFENLGLREVKGKGAMRTFLVSRLPLLVLLLVLQHALCSVQPPALPAGRSTPCTYLVCACPSRVHARRSRRARGVRACGGCRCPGPLQSV